MLKFSIIFCHLFSFQNRFAKLHILSNIDMKNKNYFLHDAKAKTYYALNLFLYVKQRILCSLHLLKVFLGYMNIFY